VEVGLKGRTNAVGSIAQGAVDLRQKPFLTHLMTIPISIL